MNEVALSFNAEWDNYRTGDRVWKSTAQNIVDYFFHATKLKRHDLLGKKVLEGGCGCGICAVALARMGGNVTAVDVADKAIARLRHLYSDEPGVTFLCGDLSMPLFRDESYDIVYSHGVIHHNRDPEILFRQLARYVKRGGLLSIGVYKPKGGLYEWAVDASRAIICRFPIPAQQLFYSALALVWRNGMSRAELMVYFFDAFSPRYRHRIPAAALIHWFISAGFTITNWIEQYDDYTITGLKQ